MSIQIIIQGLRIWAIISLTHFNKLYFIYSMEQIKNIKMYSKMYLRPPFKESHWKDENFL